MEERNLLLVEVIRSLMYQKQIIGEEANKYDGNILDDFEDKKKRIEKQVKAFKDELPEIKKFLKKVDKGEFDGALFNFINKRLKNQLKQDKASINKIREVFDKGKIKLRELEKEYEDYDSEQDKVDFLRTQRTKYLVKDNKIYEISHVFAEIIKALTKKYERGNEYTFLGIDFNKKPSYGVLLWTPKGKLDNESRLYLGFTTGVCSLYSWKILSRNDNDILKKSFKELQRTYKSHNLNIKGFYSKGLLFTISKQENNYFKKVMKNKLNDHKISLEPHQKEYNFLKMAGFKVGDIRLFLKMYLVIKWYEDSPQEAEIEYKKIKNYL